MRSPYKAAALFGLGLAVIGGAFAALPVGVRSAATQSTGRILVDGTPAQVAAIAAREGWTVVRCVPQLSYCVVERPPSGAGGPRPMPGDVRAEAETMYYALGGGYSPASSTATAGTSAPSAICERRQYHHGLLGTRDAWRTTKGLAARVAIVDTGVGPHPDTPVTLAANFLHDDNDRYTGDGHGHGTHVAGIAVGRDNDADCFAGIAPEATILSARVLSANGSGATSWINEGIVWAADNGAKVINLSLGGPTASSAMQRALQYAVSKGAVIVCAAGNDGTSNRGYPAAFPECLPVAATDTADRLTGFSTWGSWVLIAAPGDNIQSTLRGGGYGGMSGTSMAAPMVSGVMALIMARGVPADTARAMVQLRTDPIQYADSRRLAQGAGRVSAVRVIDPPLPSPTPGAPPTPTLRPPTATMGPGTSTPAPATRTPTRTATATRTATVPPTPTPTATGERCVTLKYVGQEPGTLLARYIMRDCVINP